MDLDQYKDYARLDDAGNEVVTADAAAIIASTGVRLDAGESFIFSRMLEQVKAQIFEKKYQELKARKLVPIGSGYDRDMERFTFQVADAYVQAKIITRYSTTVPVVNTAMRRYSVEPKEVGDAYVVSDKDIRQALKVGVDYLSRLLLACKRGIELAFDEILATGAPEAQLGGLANNPNVPRVLAPTGAWASATALQMLTDLLYLDHRVPVQTNEVMAANTMLLPPTLHHLAAQTPIGNNVEKTVLSTFLSLATYITSVESWTRLETAGDDNGPRIVVYPRDIEVVEGIITYDFEQAAPERKGMRTEVWCHGGTAGTVIHHPQGLLYCDNCG